MLLGANDKVRVPRRRRGQGLSESSSASSLGTTTSSSITAATRDSDRSHGSASASAHGSVHPGENHPPSTTENAWSAIADGMQHRRADEQQRDGGKPHGAGDFAHSGSRAAAERARSGGPTVRGSGSAPPNSSLWSGFHEDEPVDAERGVAGLRTPRAGAKMQHTWPVTRLHASRTTREILIVSPSTQTIELHSQDDGLTFRATLRALESLSHDCNGSGLVRLGFSNRYGAQPDQYVRFDADEVREHFFKFVRFQMDNLNGSRTATRTEPVRSGNTGRSSSQDRSRNRMPDGVMPNSLCDPGRAHDAQWEGGEPSGALLVTKHQAEAVQDMADDLLALMDPMGTGSISFGSFTECLALLGEAGGNGAQERSSGMQHNVVHDLGDVERSGRATLPSRPFSPRTQALLKRLRRLMAASEAATAEDLFARIVGVRMKDSASGLPSTLSERELREGLARLVTELRRSDLAFSRQDVLDLITTLNVMDPNGADRRQGRKRAPSSVLFHGTLAWALGKGAAGTGTLLRSEEGQDAADGSPAPVSERQRRTLAHLIRSKAALGLTHEGFFALFDRPSEGHLTRAKLVVGLSALFSSPHPAGRVASPDTSVAHSWGRDEALPYPPSDLGSPISAVSMTPSQREVATPASTAWRPQGEAASDLLFTDFDDPGARRAEGKGAMQTSGGRSQDPRMLDRQGGYEVHPGKALLGTCSQGNDPNIYLRDRSPDSSREARSPHALQFPRAANLLGPHLSQVQEVELRAEIIARTGRIPPHHGRIESYLAELEEVLAGKEADDIMDDESRVSSLSLAGTPVPSESGTATRNVEDFESLSTRRFDSGEETLQHLDGRPEPLAVAPASGASGSARLPSAANWIRRLVSKRKRRFQKDGFDLDLTYVTPRIIAMGYPSSGSEGLYRNPGSEVARLLQTHHSDKFWVFNLCSERTYAPSMFQNRVTRYPFDDHSPPKLHMMAAFCSEAAAWLAESPDHVIAVHCKAGKGRTGVMICALLLWSRSCPSAHDALSAYGVIRTSDGEGVTIPSQRRFVVYFERLLRFHWEGIAPDELNFEEDHGLQERQRDARDAGAAATPHNPSSFVGGAAAGQHHARQYLEAANDSESEKLGSTEDGRGSAGSWTNRVLASAEERRARAARGLRACLSTASVPPPVVRFSDSARLRFPSSTPVAVTSIVLSSTPAPALGTSFSPYFEISCDGVHEVIRYASVDFSPKATYQRGSHPLHFVVPSCAVVNEVRFEFWHMVRSPAPSSKARMFEFTVHTSFLPRSGRFRLEKEALDRAVKDKHCAIFPQNFNVLVTYEFIESDKGPHSPAPVDGDSTLDGS